jgi:hypothetical protein
VYVLSLLLLLLACSATPGERWRAAHPQFERQAPTSGQSLGEAMASLEEPDASPAISVSGLRLLAVDRDPWQLLDAETALSLLPRQEEMHAVVALRTCVHRVGLRRTEVPRASWLLFRGGRLEAFDHWEFGDACAPEHRLLPAAETYRRLERELSRDVARRYPASRLGPEDSFRKGLVLVEHGRVDDADATLALGNRELGEATRALNEERPDAPSEESLAEARALRAELERAIREARGIREDPEERFWRGRD